MAVAAAAAAAAATWKWVNNSRGQQQAAPAAAPAAVPAAAPAAVNAPAAEAPIEMQEVSGLVSNGQSTPRHSPHGANSSPLTATKLENCSHLF